MMLSDAEVIALYKEWSDEQYSARFMTPVPGFVTQFRTWLAERDSSYRVDYRDDASNIAMLAEYRRQEAEKLEA